MPKVITVQQFTKDLWEVQRKEIIQQLEGTVPADELDEKFPPWDKLDEETRAQKIKSVNRDLLRPLYVAGYEIQTRTNGTNGSPKRATRAKATKSTPKAS